MNIFSPPLTADFGGETSLKAPFLYFQQFFSSFLIVIKLHAVFGGNLTNLPFPWLFVHVLKTFDFKLQKF